MAGRVIGLAQTASGLAIYSSANPKQLAGLICSQTLHFFRTITVPEMASISPVTRLHIRKARHHDAFGIISL